jgi:hypothetical protein
MTMMKMKMIMTGITTRIIMTGITTTIIGIAERSTGRKPDFSPDV